MKQHNSPRIQYKQSLLLNQKKKNQLKMVIVSDSYLADGHWPDASSLMPRLFTCPCVVCNVYLDRKRNQGFGRACVMWSPSNLLQEFGHFLPALINADYLCQVLSAIAGLCSCQYAFHLSSSSVPSYFFLCAKEKCKYLT